MVFISDKVNFCIVSRKDTQIFVKFVAYEC